MGCARGVRAPRCHRGALHSVFSRTSLHALVQERHRIDVDCRRTDRTQPLFAQTLTEDTENEKGMHVRYSTISPQFGDIGAQAPTNEHIERLASILLTYNFYEKELGLYSSDVPPVHTLLSRIGQDTFRECPICAHLCMLSWAATRK